MHISLKSLAACVLKVLTLNTWLEDRSLHYQQLTAYYSYNLFHSYFTFS